jgi:hypothetical protein
MNFWDITILVFIGGLAAAALLRLHRKKKTGCPGCCSCCSQCNAGSCGAKDSE